MFRRENHVYMITFVASFRIKVGTISKLSDVMRVQMSSNIHIDRTGQNRTGQYYGETSQTTATTTTTTTTTATTATVHCSLLYMTPSTRWSPRNGPTAGKAEERPGSEMARSFNQPTPPPAQSEGQATPPTLLGGTAHRGEQTPVPRRETVETWAPTVR